MILNFDKHLADQYKSNAQRARVLTEQWVDRFIFCPNCESLSIKKYPNNQPVADFYCSKCKEDYELKSKHGEIGAKVVDGAYHKMIERITSSDNPNFFLMSYDLECLEVINFLVIPKHFFVPEIIERRRPLSSSARRAGWIGCNILLRNIPQSGKIFFVRNKKIESQENVIDNWKKTLFLRETEEASAKGWLLEIMRCIDKLNKKEFILDELYQFSGELNRLYPENKHVKEKIRQQLQLLRDKGYLDFLSRGQYRLR